VDPIARLDSSEQKKISSPCWDLYDQPAHSLVTILTPLSQMLYSCKHVTHYFIIFHILLHNWIYLHSMQYLFWKLLTLFVPPIPIFIRQKKYCCIHSPTDPCSLVMSPHCTALLWLTSPTPLSSSSIILTCTNLFPFPTTPFCESSILHNSCPGSHSHKHNLTGQPIYI